MSDQKSVYLEKIKIAISKLNAAKNVIETGQGNPYVQGTTPSEIFDYVMQNLDNPTNNQDGGGGGKKTKRRSTQKIKKKRAKNKKSKKFRAL